RRFCHNGQVIIIDPEFPAERIPVIRCLVFGIQLVYAVRFMDVPSQIERATMDVMLDSRDDRTEVGFLQQPRGARRRYWQHRNG
ncbi:hypothetical protein ACFL01_02485, partial [Planctomycetota bacterium]